MGWLECHQAIAKQCPQLVEEFIEVEEEQYKTIDIGGLKDGVTLPHMIKYSISFADKGEHCDLTLRLTRDLPINTLYGLEDCQAAHCRVQVCACYLQEVRLSR